MNTDIKFCIENVKRAKNYTASEDKVVAILFN
jgi:hypothetical protein